MLTDLPSAPNGNSNFVAYERKLLAAVKARTPLKNEGDYTIDQTPNGFRLNLKPVARARGKAIEVVWMILKEIKDDYFNCHKYDFDDGEVDSTGAFIAVAKPYELQLTPWDGKTVTVRVNNGTASLTFSYADETYFWGRRKVTKALNSETEIQIIVPPLQLGRIFPAIKINGGTGVSDDNGNDVDWQAFDFPGEWAEAPEPDPIDDTL